VLLGYNTQQCVLCHQHKRRLTFHPLSKHLHVSREVGDSVEEAGPGRLQAPGARRLGGLRPVRSGFAALRQQFEARHQGLELLQPPMGYK